MNMTFVTSAAADSPLFFHQKMQKARSLGMRLGCLFAGLCLACALSAQPINFLLKWGSFGTGDGQFDNPTDVAVDGTGNVYVADRSNDRIQKFEDVAALTLTVPTLGEWGLALLALLLLTAGLLAIRYRQMGLAGSFYAPGNLPFDRGLYARALAGTAVCMALVFAVAAAFFGYEMTGADVPGSLAFIPLAAYLAMVLGLPEGVPGRAGGQKELLS